MSEYQKAKSAGSSSIVYYEPKNAMNGFESKFSRKLD